MRQKQTDGYARRLKAALEAGPRPMSVRQLGREMGEKYPDLRGTSYGGVRQYVAGEIQNPRVELLRAMAEVLGVRDAWLAHDDGPMTEEEVEVGRIASEASDELGSSDELDAFIEAAEGDRQWKASVWLKYRTLNALGVDGPDLSPADPETLKERLDAFARGRNIRHIPHWVPLVAEARRRLDVDTVSLGDALRGPLDALDLDADAMTREELGDYISAMIPVLLTLESHHVEED